MFDITRRWKREWDQLNPVLRDGEPGVERDSSQLKIGDGRTRWVDLTFVKAPGGGSFTLPEYLKQENLDGKYATKESVPAPYTLPDRLSQSALDERYDAKGAATLPERLTDPYMRAMYQQRWRPSTAYLANETVIAPDGQVVSAKADFTSGTTFDISKWTIRSFVLPSYLEQANLNLAYLTRPPAGSSGQVLTKQSDGTHLWANSALRTVIEHGAIANTIRPVTSGPVTWIGSVEPVNWIDGDDWRQSDPVIIDIPTAGLVAYWRAEDLQLAQGQAVASLANRVSGGPALVAAGGPVFDIEGSMMSILLDGVDDHLSETTLNVAQPTTTVTIGRFVTAAASKQWTSAASTTHGISSASTSKWSMNGGTALSHTTNIDTGWHCVSAVYNNTSSIMNVDGLNVSGASGTQGRVGTRVGTNSGISSFTNMKISLVAVYNYAMTATELNNIRANLKNKYPVLP